MLKTIKNIKFIAVFALAMILPITSFASHSDAYGGFEFEDDYWSGAPSSYDYDYYSPVYQDVYDYTPYSYDYPTDYGYGGYSTPSYGYNYPSYSTPSYGSSYPSYGGISYGGTSVP